MFKIAVTPFFELSVDLTEPGSGTVHTLKLTAVPLKADEFRAWQLEATEDPPPAEWLSRVITGWGKGERVLDEADKPVDFSMSALAGLLNTFPAATGEINRAYAKALHESRAGN